MMVFDKDNFDSEVLAASSGLVLVDFWGPQCEPCIALMPAIEALEEKYGDKMKFGKVDVSKNRRLAIGQQVMGLPAILFYKDGEKVGEMPKDFTAKDVEAKINELI